MEQSRLWVDVYLCRDARRVFVNGLKVIEQAIEGETEVADFYARWGLVLLEFAVNENDDEKLGEAIEKLEAALELEPGHVEGAHDLARALRFHALEDDMVEPIRRSIELLEEALERNPSHPLLLTGLAQSQVALGRYYCSEDEYIRAFDLVREAARNAPEDIRVRRVWGDLMEEYLQFCVASRPQLPHPEGSETVEGPMERAQRGRAHGHHLD